MTNRQMKKLHKKMMKQLDAAPVVRKRGARPTVVHRDKKRDDWFRQEFEEMITDSQERYDADKG